MKKIFDYNHNKYVGSVSFSNKTNEYLLQNGLNPIYFNDDGSVLLIKEGLPYQYNTELKDYISSLNELDVIEIETTGQFRHVLNQQSDDATLFITEKCNSNCIMCPYSESIRKNSSIPDSDYIIEIAKHFPTNINHITITGGEPFMIKDDLFSILNIFNHKYYDQEVLLLTNGRVFCIDKYVENLTIVAPRYLIVGIPLHAHTQILHDLITQTNGSFYQTSRGISKLIRNHINVEIRVVINKINFTYLNEIALYISKHFSNVFRVVFMGLEMVGNAAINRDNVWVSYKQSATYLQKAIDILVSNGITTRIYNFPLCIIEKKYWPLCDKSISDYKIIFSEICNVCVVKNNCGGLFNGTFGMEEEELQPIKEKI